MTNLLYSDTEEEMRDSVRALLTANCPAERVSAMYDGDSSLAVDLWQAVSAMELPGLGVADSMGG